MCIVHRVSHRPISEGVYWSILTEIDKRQRTDSSHAPKVEGGGGGQGMRVRDQWKLTSRKVLQVLFTLQETPPVLL